MIIFLSELQKDHLRLLHQHSTQVLVDFCKLAIDFLNNGINQKKYSIAAEKLNVSSTAIQNLVHALTSLIVEGCKHNLLETDFKSSLAIAGFTEEQSEVLMKFYSTKKTELSEALNLLQIKDPSYQDLIWRFEIQVASRISNEEVRPTILIDFVLSMPKPFGKTQADKKNNEDTYNVYQTTNMPIQSAKTARQCQHTIQHILLQCNLSNLVHLANKLDIALKESKTQHVRKVQRALQ
ncbi:COMM domain-containing protein 2-like [Leguminivora glycinivorella]|uniref:COMM domain-containing protein 2-like n=1 Tax=Leguminivora glycinivorella TaxID=1035111 RepID=UPI00200F548D|nr:COMM domain-containing protein 2-like [Leguminivora glycinivorella]